MVKVEIYSKGYCPYCKNSKATLNHLGIKFEEYDITYDKEKALEMRTRSNRQTVPQIFIDDYHVGGNDDLHLALQSGQLHKLLKINSANA